MITNNRIRGHLGSTPNKSVDLLDPFICSRSPSDLSGTGNRALFLFPAFCTPTSAFCIGQIHLPDDPLATEHRIWLQGPFYRSGSQHPFLSVSSVCLALSRCRPFRSFAP